MQTEITKHLLGDKFHDALPVSFPSAGPVLARNEQLLQLVEGKRVIHVGCCDHTEILEERIKANMWLHSLLTEKAEKCLGIDINRQGVELCRRASGLDNIMYGDVSQPGIKEISNEKWDIVLFADVLEHIPNPTQFLSGFKASYASAVASIIVSVPNSLRAGNFLGSLRSKETINTDHYCEYSPFTISKTLASAGIVLDKMYFSVFSKETGFRAYIFRKYPYLCHTLIAHAPLK
jgi:Methyltransferase domain